MVIGVILREAFRAATIVAKGYAKYNKYESKAFARAWRGYPRSVRLGTRHGFVTGSVIGSVIGSPMEGSDIGFSQEQKLPSADKLDKKYSQRRRPFTYSYSNRQNYKSRSRRPCTCGYNRGKKRFYR